MITTIIIMLMFAVLIMIMNHKDRFTLLFGMQTFCAAIMFFACFLMVAKLANYSSSLSADMTLYLRLRSVNLRIDSIVRMFNISNCLFMCICYFQSDFFRSRSFSKALLLLIPAILTAAVNDSHLKYLIFIGFADSESALSFRSIYNIIYMFTAAVNILYCIMPNITILHGAQQSQIRLNKKRMLSLYSGLLTIIIFVLSVIVFGPYRFMYFISTVYFPYDVPSWNSHVYIPVAPLIILTVYMILIYKYNPIYLFPKPPKQTIYDTDSVRMLFHNYKNEFFIIERLARQISQNPDSTKKNAAIISEIAKDSSTAISKIIESFKNDFAFNPNRISLTRCVQKAILKSNIPNGIDVSQCYCSNDIIIYGNEPALCDAFVNVINNAADSVNCNTGEKNIWISVFSERNLSCVEIRDNGKGIEKKECKKIFLPFYSTKHGGRNNGIGLTYTKKIVSEHQGKIDLKSIPNQLTSFQIVFLAYKAKKRK